MIEISSSQFSQFSENFKNKPFEVTPAYIDYKNTTNNDCLFFTDSVSQPMVLCWARVKKIKFIGLVLSIEGPIFTQELTQKQLCKFFKNITNLPFMGFFINSTSTYSVLFEEAIRNANFKRPIGQSSTNLTIVVDTFDFNPDSNWRRNLKKAAKVNYKFEVQQELSIEDCFIVEKLHKENSEIKKLSFQLNATEIHELCKGDNIEVCFLKLESEYIAARIISIEENISYDIFACNSLASRSDGATQFLMQNIFEYLAGKNIQYFDFSRIPIGRKGAQGVYDFKRSTKGKVVQYNSEWVYLKNKKLRHFYYLYNLIINKKDFY